MFGAFSLYLSLGLGTLFLDLVLPGLLLPSERERDDGERERDYEQLQPIPGWLPAELSKRPRLAVARWFLGVSSPRTLASCLLLLHGCSLFLHSIISYA